MPSDQKNTVLDGGHHSADLVELKIFQVAYAVN